MYVSDFSVEEEALVSSAVSERLFPQIQFFLLPFSNYFLVVLLKGFFSGGRVILLGGLKVIPRSLLYITAKQVPRSSSLFSVGQTS